MPASPRTLSEEEVKLWQGRLELARRCRDLYGDTKKRWEKNVKAMAGDFGTDDPEGIDVNLIHGNLEALISPQAVVDPAIAVTPTQERIEIGGQDVDNVQRAELTEVEINYWLRELGVRRTVERCLYDLEATNHMYALVWYTRKGEATREDGEKTEADPLVREGQPFVKRLSPRQVLVQPGHAVQEEADWIAIEYLRRLDDVVDAFGVKDEDLPLRQSLFDKNLVTQNTEAIGFFSDYLSSDDNKGIVVQQIFDKRRREVIHLARGATKALSVEKWTLETEGFPVAHEHLVDVPDEYYGPPPITLYLPQQKELNAARTAMKKRFQKTKHVVLAGGTVGEDLKESYKAAEDGEILSVPGIDDDDIRSRLMELAVLGPDEASIIYGNIVSADLREISGVSSQRRGAGDPNIDTATESAIVDRSAQIRQSKRADRTRSFYLQIARRLWMILKQQPGTIERTRRIAGPNAGSFRQIRYTLDELRGEFGFDLDVTTFYPRDTATRAAQAIANYNLLRPDPLIDPKELLLEVFRSQHRADPERFFLFLRDPGEELRAFLQGLPVEAHERDDHERHLAQHELNGREIEDAIGKMAASGDVDSPEGEKLRLALALLVAHQNDHARHVQRLAGPQPTRTAGRPIAENMLRSSLRERPGGETAAELSGNPLTAGLAGGGP